jgi:hypothetical protein
MQRMREVIGSGVPLIGGVIAPSYRRDAIGRVVVEDGLGHLPFVFALFSSCERIKTSSFLSGTLHYRADQRCSPVALRSFSAHWFAFAL